MNFLAINTVGENVEVALSYGGGRFFASDPEYRKASEVLVPLIDKVLSDASADISEMDFFACCVGPGSFTGIRIGLSTVRAFCQSLSRPVLAVTSSLVLSYNDISSIGDGEKTVITLSDAGNGYSYVAVYDGVRTVLMPPKCLETELVGKFLETVDEPYAVCADSLSSCLASETVIHKADGDALYRAVMHELGREGLKDFGVLEPLYVRKSQAEALAERAAK